MPQNIFNHSIKSEVKNTISLSIPFIASNLIYASSGFIGTAMVARLGKNALAASVLVSMIWMTLSVLFFGILNAVSILISHQHGAKNNKAISEIMGQAYLLGIVICVFIIATLCSMPLFLHWSSQPPPVLHLAHQYMRALLWTIPGLVTLVVSEQFLIGIGLSKIVLRLSIFLVIIEIPFNYLFIFGKFGLPACGVSGIGYGLTASYTTTAIALVLYLLKSKSFKQFGIFTRLGEININYLKELIRIGLPMGFMYVIEISTFAIATFWIAQFGTTVLAANQIMMQYLGFTVNIIFAMSQTVAVRVGHAVGRQDLPGVQRAIYVGMILNFFCMLIIAIAFYLFPTLFLRLDLNALNPLNELLVQNASILLSICGVLLLFDNFRIIGFGALRGLKDTRFPMLASFISFWLIGLSLAYLFSFTFHLAEKGIWWGLTVGIASGAIILFIRLQYLLRRVDLAKLIQLDSSSQTGAPH